MKHKLFRFAIVLGAFPALLSISTATESLQSFRGCTLVPMRGADGDSFLVKFPDNKKRVVRLYAVDCIEAKIWDEADSRRLREQRRYFGISNCRSTPQASIQVAKEYGHLATRETTSVLSKPFTVHTSFADGRGSGYQKRIYAFVTTASGVDLGSHLVAKGLARAFGVCRSSPGGYTGEELRARLEDMELLAAKLGKGVWSLTNWASFTNERSEQRHEQAELALAIDREKHTGIVDPNTAPRDELMTLHGIGETLAVRIIEARPYKNSDDLLKVKGFGEGTLIRLQDRLPEAFRTKSTKQKNR
ncbi:MAG: helix-hairpin-helix domain-containing protein [Verrucomicrobiales bacterium]|nr:helix-hairpin-helix domain-containing protein [Verrucomicrobiales bacterium]